jgi:hypothetical protein
MPARDEGVKRQLARMKVNPASKSRIILEPHTRESRENVDIATQNTASSDVSLHDLDMMLKILEMNRRNTIKRRPHRFRLKGLFGGGED